MRLTDLRDAKVKTLDGKTLGHVHEVHAEGGRIVAVTCGASSLIERLTATEHGGRIEWDCVVRIGEGEVVVRTEGPEAKPKRRAPRSRQGTRRPSGPRSGR